MKIIDQHTALAAQETALIPASSLLDGRTEIDRLAFLSDFASLINFYDHDNNIHGNWTPFLLKDPAILLAHITKTAVDQFLALYHNICNQIAPLVHTSKISKDLVIGMDHLFDLLTGLFVKIERWTHYMLLNPTEYELKKYLLHQVKAIYSKQFWALLSLRDQLSVLPFRHKIKPPYYYLYDNFDNQIWKQQKGKSPYWEILGLPHQIDKDISPAQIYESIKILGDQLLNFVEAIVSFAPKAYETVKAIRGKYPDTLLIRAFVSLLEHYNTQLNGLSAQHLDFYYQDILKQTLQTSVADEVLIFANLAKPDTTFKLPAQTLFNGGLDEQKNSILFETLTDVNLNPAVINNVYTISKFPNSNNLTTPQKVANPGVILKDENGAVQSWPFFGNSDVASAKTGLSGFIMASPLLYLREGTRTITLVFANTVTIKNLQNASFYLSTAADWYAVNAKAIDASQNNQMIITLLPGEPEIIPFLVKPDQLDNTWPMLKIEFTETESLIQLNNTTAINLSVTATGLKSLQFYNDFGTISPNSAYQPFGPLPLLNSSFIVGSNEIFSKPLTAFSIALDWNNLPHNFADYYTVYNQYLSGQFTYLPLLQRIINWLTGNKASNNLVYTPFNNFSFTSQFMLLQQGSWQTLNMAVPITDVVVAETPAEMVDMVQTIAPQLPLFQVEDVVLQPKSSFLLSDANPNKITLADPKLADPAIQTDPQFKYTSASTSGFMKMVLSGYKNGFGSEIYPTVVTQVATYNAWQLYNHQDISTFAAAPALPFSPKLADLSATYTAEISLSEGAAYPFQCYVYSPLAIKPFAFTPVLSVGAQTEAAKPVGTIPALTTNQLLFSASNEGFLFLEIDQLVPSESFNIYFELTTDQAAIATARKVTYYYLNEAGWKPLDILADGTANFNCSGIVSMAVPTDISLQTFIGEKKHFWIALVADGTSGSFPSVVVIKTNGIRLQRSAGEVFTNNLVPASINKPQNPIPQIALITQPFPSFGGKPAENAEQMKQRVSLRLKTKDRAVGQEDYYRLITKAYPAIFYTQILFNSITKTNEVFVVPAYADWQAANAFQPRVNQEVLNNITAFLADRSSGLTGLVVSNFDLAPICVNASIQVQVGFTCEGVKKNVNQALNLYLSPWIAGNQTKVTIGETIENVNLANFMQNIPGVAQVQNVDYSYINSGINAGKGKLTISGMNHTLNCSY